MREDRQRAAADVIATASADRPARIREDKRRETSRLPQQVGKVIRKGTRFLVLHDFELTALVSWRAPMTSGLRCTIPNGAILVAFGDSLPILGGVTCIPENPDAFQRDHVPEEIRTDPRFAGISFVVTDEEIKAHLMVLAVP